MPFTLISWNIEKINVNKAQRFGQVIAKEINEKAAKNPCLVILYENKRSPEEVLGILRNALPNFWSDWIPCGGGSNTSENILFLYREVSVCRVEKIDMSAELHGLTEWEKEKMNAAAIEKKDCNKERGLRDYMVTICGVLKKPEWYRSPVIISVTAGGKAYNVACWHAPGPDHMKALHFEDLIGNKILEICFNKIQRECHIFIGDFNMRSINTEIMKNQGWEEIIFGSFGTTTDKKSGEPGCTKWDRMYVKSSANLQISYLDVIKVSRDVSDHIGLVVDIDQTSTGFLDKRNQAGQRNMRAVERGVAKKLLNQKNARGKERAYRGKRSSKEKALVGRHGN